MPAIHQSCREKLVHINKFTDGVTIGLNQKFNRTAFNEVKTLLRGGKPPEALNLPN
jgi:hypothetical protein